MQRLSDVKRTLSQRIADAFQNLLLCLRNSRAIGAAQSAAFWVLRTYNFAYRLAERRRVVAAFKYVGNAAVAVCVRNTRNNRGQVRCGRNIDTEIADRIARHIVEAGAYNEDVGFYACRYVRQ